MVNGRFYVRDVTGHIKKTTTSKKKTKFSEERHNTDYSRLFLDELGKTASESTASRFKTVDARS